MPIRYRSNTGLRMGRYPNCLQKGASPEYVPTVRGHRRIRHRCDVRAEMYRNQVSKLKSSMYEFNIGDFENDILSYNDSNIDLISLPGWYVAYSENTLASIHSQNIFYDKTWRVFKLKNEEY
ncbi:hypothetical protein RF11_04447 [Thelohanellus kitauei]|uniref:Uncharacterized protein n=1 Tax=Thelohanellus kitauei TaxID=669202 RepID=A0A0C2MT82_THEKT|nr:hypothetical protein RF11_04447 [Thelohanellus kitauei]